MSDPTNTKVFLVGAGPGNPGLLTLRAAELLAKADLVLYDQLVPLRLLEFANPAAELLCVRDLPGHHPDKYPHIHTMLIERARSGKVVVRLKGGDPLIFGRGGEEAEALRRAGVAYEIVPGVTAALAVGAFLEVPLTHRNFASAVAFVTGHELPHKPGNPLDWKALAAFPGTLCIYMGVAKLPVIVSELLKYGKPADTPACIVERASTGEQRTVVSKLANLEEDRRLAGLEAPGLIVIGEAVAHRPEHSWWESRPLFGQRVLVTRPAHQSAGMVRKLEQLGAVVYRMSSVEIREPADFGPLDRALARLGGTGFQPVQPSNLGLGGTGFQPVQPSNLGGTGFQPVQPSNLGLGGTGFQPVRRETVTRRNLPHIQIPGASYHLTFRTKELILSLDARAAVLAACRFWDGKKLHLHAAVVMPDHVHLLLTPLTEHDELTSTATNLSEILHSIKGFSSKQVNKLMDRSGIVWLDESYDRYIRSESDFEEKYDYIAGNPVKEGLASLPEEYPFLYLEFGQEHRLEAGATQTQKEEHRLEATQKEEHRLEAGATQTEQQEHRLEAGATQKEETQPTWDWVVFTSANGVHAFMRRIDAIGCDLRLLGRVKLAAIGPKTAEALRAYHLKPDIVPGTFNSEGLAEALASSVGNQRVLLARANRGRDLLREELSKIATVEQVTVYDQVDTLEPDAEILDHLRRGEIRFVPLSSSKIAENLIRGFDETIRGRVMRSEIQLVAISPETARAIEGTGLAVAAVAAEFTTDGLIEAIVKLAKA